MGYRDIPAMYLPPLAGTVMPAFTRFAIKVECDPANDGALTALRSYLDSIMDELTVGATILLWNSPPHCWAVEDGFMAEATLSREGAWGSIPGGYDYTVSPPSSITLQELSARMGT